MDIVFLMVQNILLKMDKKIIWHRNQFFSIFEHLLFLMGFLQGNLKDYQKNVLNLLLRNVSLCMQKFFQEKKSSHLSLKRERKRAWCIFQHKNFCCCIKLFSFNQLYNRLQQRRFGQIKRLEHKKEIKRIKYVTNLKYILQFQFLFYNSNILLQF